MLRGGFGGAGLFARTDPQLSKMRAERFASNPLVTAELCGDIGDNINGPSVIRVPDWIKSPLGRYYMYFAHHSGDYIRLAYADKLEGPWSIYRAGTLQLGDARAFKGHIASPDVHVIEDMKQIRMYFHGPLAESEDQFTGVAHSTDGINFSASKTILGDFYFRVWKWNDCFYALSKNGNKGWCGISRSKNGITAFTEHRAFLKRGRHVALLVQENRLLIAFTRVGDAPERIFVSSVNMEDHWTRWSPSRPVELLRPNTDYEGADYPVARSKKGPAINVNQLRDPCIFEENGQIYIFYSIAGEMGIAGGKLYP